MGHGEFSWDGSFTQQRMNQAHFSLWCITSAPLIAGNDVRSASAGLTAILTNPEAIAVNQQFAGNAGDILTAFNSSAASTSTDTLEVWMKPLRGARVAFALLNRVSPALKGKHCAQTVLGRLVRQ